jgi:hypothetical protein
MDVLVLGLLYLAGPITIGLIHIYFWLTKK